MWMCPCVCVCDRFPTLSDILRVWFRKTVLRFKTEIYSHRRTYSSTHNYTHTKPPYINRKGVDEEKKENATINFKFPTGGNELRYERYWNENWSGSVRVTIDQIYSLPRQYRGRKREGKKRHRSLLTHLCYPNPLNLRPNRFCNRNPIPFNICDDLSYY